VRGTEGKCTECVLVVMNDKELVLLAPVSGVIYPLERVPDPVFSQKLAGDGISIDPIDNVLRAPCAGEILQRHAAGHALTLKAAGDVEVLMHIGIDTITLKRHKRFFPMGRPRAARSRIYYLRGGRTRAHPFRSAPCLERSILLSSRPIRRPKHGSGCARRNRAIHSG